MPSFHFISPEEGRKLAEFLGTIQDGSAKGPFATKAAGLIAEDDQTKFGEVVDMFVDATPALLAAEQPLAAVEDAYRVLAVLVDDAPEEMIPLLVSKIINPILEDTKNVVKKNGSKTTPEQNRTGLKVRALTTLFNVIAADGLPRYDIFNAILDVVAASNDSSLIMTQLAHLQTWLTKWGVTEKQRSAIYKKLSEQLQSENEESAFEWLVHYIKTEQGSTDQDAIKNAIIQAISIPSHLRFNHLLKVPAIGKYLNYECPASATSLPSLTNKEIPDLYKLLDIFVRGNYNDYILFAKENKTFLESIKQLKSDDSIFKIRVLTIASLSTKIDLPGEIPYSQIAQAIGTPVEEVEIWIINAIRAGLVDAKMDQLHKNLVVTRASYRQFTKHDWEVLEKKLKAINL